MIYRACLRTLGVLTLSLGLVSSALIVPATAATEPQSLLNTILFHGAQYGWIGGAGTILATTDGGRTWTRQYAGPATITHFSFVTDSTGWALGTDTLLSTVDGGRTWTAAGEPAAPLRQVDFVTSSRGWGIAGAAATTRSLYRTRDAGRTWQRLGFPVPIGAVCFADRMSGWIATAMSTGHAPIVLLATRDGGTTWRPAAAPPGSEDAGGFVGQALGCSSPRVVWDLVSYGGYAGGEGYALYRSVDGGDHWQTVAQGMAPAELQAAHGPGTAPGDLAVVSAMTAYLTGTCFACGATGQGTTALGATRDGGRSWQNVGLPGLPTTTTALSFPTTREGWLVAQWSTESGQPTSAVLRTTDGGRVWQRQYPAPLGTVRVTFTLSLYGVVPAGQEFSIAGTPAFGGGAGVMTFCTTIAPRLRLGLAACTGLHTVYTRSVVVPRGSTVRFSFLRATTTTLGAPDIFYSGARPVDRDMAISAYYRFAP